MLRFPNITRRNRGFREYKLTADPAFRWCSAQQDDCPVAKTGSMIIPISFPCAFEHPNHPILPAFLDIVAYGIDYISARELFKISDNINQLVTFPGGCDQMHVIAHDYPGM